MSRSKRTPLRARRAQDADIRRLRTPPEAVACLIGVTIWELTSAARHPPADSTGCFNSRAGDINPGRVPAKIQVSLSVSRMLFPMTASCVVLYRINRWDDTDRDARRRPLGFRDIIKLGDSPIVPV